MATHREYALIAEAAYKPDEQNDSNFGLRQNWTRRNAVNYHLDNNWGYRACYFVNHTRGEEEIVFAIRGTKLDRIWSLLIDYGIVRGQIPPMIADAQIDITESVRSTIKDRRANPPNEIDAEGFRRVLAELEEMVAPDTDNLTPERQQLYEEMEATKKDIEKWGKIKGFSLMTMPAAFISAPLIIASMGAAYYSDQQQNTLSKKLKTLFGQWVQFMGEERTARAIQIMREQLPAYKITLVGHSLGGLVAQILACKLGVKAVTFDSPGARQLIEAVPGMNLEENDNYRSLIFSYLSSPNIINCTGGQLGTVYRIYIDHVENKWTWSHAFMSATADTGRMLLYGAAATATIATAGTGAATFSSAGTMAAVGGAGLGAETVSQFLFKNPTWTYRQHSMQSFLGAFNTQLAGGTPKKIWSVGKWPDTYMGTILHAQLGRWLDHFKLGHGASRGFFTMFDENSVMEAQLGQLPGYEITLVVTPADAIAEYNRDTQNAGIDSQHQRFMP